MPSTTNIDIRMRIEEIRVYSKQVPVSDGTYRMASSDVKNLDSTIVEIVSDEGLSGWGETCPIGSVYQPHHALGARAALAELAPGLIGQEAGSIRGMARRMDECLSGHGYAKAAIDIAVFDLLGKKLRVPVSTLLGGALTDRVPSYYSVTTWQRSRREPRCGSVWLSHSGIWSLAHHLALRWETLSKAHV
jgi:4-hydroxyproline betaine 2-epimerase